MWDTQNMAEMTMKDARAHFGDVVDEARMSEAVVVTKHGRPVAAVVGFDEWQSVVELAEEMTDIRAYDAAKAEQSDPISLEDLKAELGL